MPDGARDLASGNPDPELLPDLTPVAAHASSRRASSMAATRPIRSCSSWRPAELGRDGIPAEDLAVVSGALDGIERALAAQLRPGDVVAVEDPGFAGLFHLLRALGLALRPVAIDARGMIPAALGEALEQGVAAVVLNPRGQNPTGASLDPERAATLRARPRSPPRRDAARRRPPRPDRRRSAPDPDRGPQPLGRSPLTGQVSGPRPAAGRPSRRPRDDQPSTRPPSRRPRLGKPPTPAHRGGAVEGQAGRP